MANVTGIGGVFIFANDAAGLADWYRDMLGLALTHDAQANNYYVALWSRDLQQPEVQLQTVFAIMPSPTKLDRRRGEYLINYRVDDLEGLVGQLKVAGVEVGPIEMLDDGQGQGQGKFCQLRDLEGNRIELWEHVG